MKPRVVILSGPPGAGKTTLAKLLAAGGPSYKSWIGAADDIHETPEGYKFDIARLAEGHATCFRGFIHACMMATVDSLPKLDLIVVHNTALTNWERAPYVQCAQAYDLPHLVVTLNVHPLESGPRNVHGVPADRLAQMWEKREKLLPFWPQMQLESCEAQDIVQQWVKPILAHFEK